MGLALAVAQRSEDPSIRHGCILVAKKTNIILATGYNGLLSKLSPDKVDIHTRPEKYKWFWHSEDNAISHCLHPLKLIDGGVKAYITGLPCIGGNQGPGCAQRLAREDIKDWYVLKRRGFLAHNEEIQKDFDFIVREKGINVTYVDLTDVDWLRNIEV
jgi:deoxycytidylate deaminase